MVDNGFCCLKPCVGEKKPFGEQLIKMEKWDEARQP